MKELTRVVFGVATGALAAAACAGQSSAGNGAQALSGGVGVRSSDTPVLAVASGATAPKEDEPAHVFTPRPHVPKRHSTRATVDPKNLPALRTASCFVIPKPSPTPSRWRSGPGVTGGSGAFTGGALQSSGRGLGGTAAPKPTKKSTPTTAAPAPEGGAYELARPAPAAAPPLAPPAPAPKAEAVARDEEKRAAVQAAAPIAPTADGAYYDYGASIYLSNDDTMSLSSAQRVLFAIDRFLPIQAEHVRPHELLNYFSFDSTPVQSGYDFSVLPEIEQKPGEEGVYTLALSISGRAVEKTDRRNAALTFVIDRSGSMDAEGRMDYLKRGLLRMTSELKRGDLVNLVLFDDEVCVPFENFVVGRDSMQTLTSTIQKLQPRGSTDLDAGLRRGYSLADRSYQATHSNRVVLITDALANTGQTDPELISMISSHYDKRRIRLSGVGVGTDFNDHLLDRLTERGKGAYVFLGSGAEVDAVFGDRFVSLIETVANDVHFRLHLPPSLGMKTFFGEESSTSKADVQAVHYFAGTNQLFLSDLNARGGILREQDSVMLTIEYENAETGTAEVEEYAFRLGDILGGGRNVEKARLVMSFIDGVADTVRSSPTRSEYRRGGWLDANASEQCERGRASLAEQSRALDGDPEVRRVVSLWDSYCARYEPLRAPIRRTPPRGSAVWPSAMAPR